MSNPIALPEIFQAAFEDFIIPSYETAPNTTIQNRAKVVRSLKAIAGVERIMCKGVNILPDEFGPNGEQVLESSDKDSRIRMVGSGWISIADASGTSIQSSTLGDFLEITFYGTGVNWVYATYSIAADLRVSVDGGAEGSNIWVGTTYSNVLNQRNYSQNTLINLASGLSLGWHTVKLRFAAAVAVRYFGFEVLNQRTDLAVYSGTGISNGSSQGLSALTTSAFNAGVSGTRGARVVKYVQGGVVSQAVQEVDATSKYLTLADHTNEEVVRRINFREFGANRADDFSTLAGITGSSRAFTLDDGTTTLAGTSVIGTSVGANEDYMGSTAAGGFFLITFVGTGLDIYAIPGTSGVQDSSTVTVDGGTSVGTILNPAGNGKLIRVCSGLPYGTHTVKFTRNAVTGFGLAVADFITYRPKTPSIPAGALKVAAYNVMADFSATAIVSPDAISSGVLNKSQAREFIYVGTWAAALNATVKNGITIASSTVGNYVEYTFWGTGFSIVANVGVSGTATLSVDGSNYSGATVTAGSVVGAVWTMATTNGGRIRVNGLTLGKHTVRLTVTTNSGALFIHGIDVVTPIHAQESSFKVGSNSLKSVTKYSPEKSIANAGPDLSKAKAWVIYDGINQKILATFGVSAVLRSGVGQYYFYMEKPFKTANWVTNISSNTFGRQALTPIDGGQYKNTTTQFVQLFTQPGAASDGVIYMTCFGELIDE